jgi:hypothetical protein
MIGAEWVFVASDPPQPRPNHPRARTLTRSAEESEVHDRGDFGVTNFMIAAISVSTFMIGGGRWGEWEP